MRWTGLNETQQSGASARTADSVRRGLVIVFIGNAFLKGAVDGQRVGGVQVCALSTLKLECSPRRRVAAIQLLRRSTSSALDENACRKRVLQAAMRDQLAGARALVGAA